jgi:WD40 repeat protein
MATRDRPQYDLFVSYADADGAWVEGYLLDALTQAGVRIHSEEAFALGAPRLVEFERAVQGSQRTLLVLSPAYLAEGSGQFTNLLAQSYGMETATWPVIPLLLRPTQLPPRLATLLALDATDPDRWGEVVDRLCAELQRPVPGPVPRPPCPYPGMVPFSEDDSGRFFGRDQEVQAAIELLRLHPFLTVIGPSGSGKSSLVAAGIVPALRKSSLFGPDEPLRDGSQWLVRSLRPGGSPLAALAATLGRSLVASAEQAVSALLATQPSARHLLLIVDQFEEVFTVSTEHTEAFQQALARLAQVPNCYVVLTARADFYPDLMACPLWSEIQSHRLEVLPMSEAGLRQAIVRPAEDVGVYAETALVERLVADAAGEPGILPLIQETLVLLWERVERRFLPLRAYDALVLSRGAYGGPGRTGLEVAIAHRADAVLAQLAPEQQTIARGIFLRLVQFGEGRADTRRQQSVSALRSYAQDAGQFQVTLAHLTDNRLLTLSGEEGLADPRVDIAHESLITGWPQLVQWISGWREAEQTRRRLEAKADEWVRRRRGGLLDEAELAEAERWLGSDDAQELGYKPALPRLVKISRRVIEDAREREVRQERALASEQQRAEMEKRSAIRLRRWAVWLGVVLVFAIMGGILAVAFWQKAQDSAAEARTAEAEQVVLKDEAETARAEEAVAKAAAQAGSTRAVQAEIAAQNGATQEAIAKKTAQAGATNAVLAGATAQAGATEAAIARASAEVDSERARSAEATAQAGATQEAVAKATAQAGATQEARARATATAAVATAVGDRATAQAGATAEARAKATAEADRAAAETAEAEAIAEQMTAEAEKARADEQAQLAASRQLAAQAINLADAQHDLALLLSLEADRLADTAEAKSSLLTVLQRKSRLIKVLRGHSKRAYTVAFSPNGEILASGSWDEAIRLWDVSDPDNAKAIPDPVTGDPDGVELTGHAWGVGSVAFSPPDGRQWLVAGDGDGRIHLWDVSDPGNAQLIGEPLAGHTKGKGVESVAFSPKKEEDKTIIASAAGDNKVCLWSLAPQGGSVPSSSAGDGTVMTPTLTLVYSITDIAWPTSVAFSPDGNTLVAGYKDGTIHVWDVSAMLGTGVDAVQSIVVPGHTGGVWSVAFSPEKAEDKTIMASGGCGRKEKDVCTQGEIRLWSLASSSAGDVSDPPNVEPIGGPLLGHAVAVQEVTFSPDGKTLASGSEDGDIRLWNVDKVQQIDRLSGHDPSVWCVAFSPKKEKDRLILASGGADNTVRLWGVPDPGAVEPIGQRLSGHISVVESVAFSPDAETLASGSWDSTVWLWDVTDPYNVKPIDQLTDHTDEVASVAFSPKEVEGKTILASGSWDGKVWLWDVTNPYNVEPIGQLTDHTEGVESVAFSPKEVEGKTILASGSWDGEVWLWDATTRQSIGQLTGHTEGVESVAFSPDGETLASGGGDGVCLWNVSNPDSAYAIGRPLTDTMGVLTVAFSPDGKILASGCRDGTVWLWDAATWQSIGQLTGHTDGVESVAFSQDGKILASGSSDTTVWLWDAATRQSIGQLTGHTEGVESVAFSPDGEILASGGWDNAVWLWDVDFDSWKDRACLRAGRNLTQAEWQRYVGDKPYCRTCSGLPSGEGAPPDAPACPPRQ